MKKTIIKEYEIEEGIVVIHQTLDALYQKYCNCIPKNIENKVLDLIVETEDLMNVTKDERKNICIIKDTILRKIEFKEEFSKDS